LTTYSRKLKRTGILAGHDFIQGSWSAQIPYGVQQEVIEFCHEHDWEVLYLTVEQSIDPSFAIKAIDSATSK